MTNYVVRAAFGIVPAISSWLYARHQYNRSDPSKVDLGAGFDQLPLGLRLAKIDSDSILETAAAGSTILGCPLLYLDPRMMDKKGAKFVISHEITHLDYSDSIVGQMVFGGVASIASMAFYAASQVLCPQAGLFLGTCREITAIGLGYLSGIAYSRYSEARADAVASAQCSPEERLEAIELFRSVIQQNRLIRFFFPMAIAPNGDSRVDLKHPPLSSRISRLEKDKRP